MIRFLLRYTAVSIRWWHENPRNGHKWRQNMHSFGKKTSNKMKLNVWFSSKDWNKADRQTVNYISMLLSSAKLSYPNGEDEMDWRPQIKLGHVLFASVQVCIVQTPSQSCNVSGLCQVNSASESGRTQVWVQQVASPSQVRVWKGLGLYSSPTVIEYGVEISVQIWTTFKQKKATNQVPFRFCFYL
jgi:hypothetical protein